MTLGGNVMNKDNAISKINKIGKVGAILSKIAMIALEIGCIATIVGGIIFLTIPREDIALKINNEATLTVNTDNKMIGGLTETGNEISADNLPQGSMDINGTDYSFTDVSFDSGSRIANFQLTGDEVTITSGRIAAVCFVAAAYMAIYAVLFFFVKKLCKSLEVCDSPFEEGIIKGMKNCAWVLIPWCVLGGSLESILTTAFTSNIRTGFNISIPTAIVILLLFGLAYVFKYGAVLQTESDETL